MSFFRYLGSVGLAFLVLPVAQGESRRPANVTSLPLRLIQRSLIVVSVRINHSGPHDFMVDTGAQISAVDTSLAAELHLKTEGTTGSVGGATFSRNEFVHMQFLEAGERSVTNSPGQHKKTRVASTATPFSAHRSVDGQLGVHTSCKSA